MTLIEDLNYKIRAFGGVIVFKETKTYKNLCAAFAGESQANRRYQYFAERADDEGCSEVKNV